MNPKPTRRSILAGVILLACAPALRAADSPKPAPKEGTVAGLFVEKKPDALFIINDGDEEPTKYLVDKKTQEAIKNVFDAARVRVKWKLDGEERRAISVEKAGGQPRGTIVGEVEKVYNNFWVSVKPKGGLLDGYALNGAPDKVKKEADVLKSLEKGDVVSIKYATDFERHRILTIEVKKKAGK